MRQLIAYNINIRSEDLYIAFRVEIQTCNEKSAEQERWNESRTHQLIGRLYAQAIV